MKSTNKYLLTANERCDLAEAKADTLNDHLDNNGALIAEAAAEYSDALRVRTQLGNYWAHGLSAARAAREAIERVEYLGTTDYPHAVY